MEKASEAGLVFAGLVLLTRILYPSPLAVVGRANLKSKLKLVFFVLSEASWVGVAKLPFASDNSKIKELSLFTKGVFHVNFTKYSLKSAEAQTAVHGLFPAIFGLSAGIGLLSVCAMVCDHPSNNRAINIM